MTVVLVHGNPETSAIWEPITPLFNAEEIVALSPPGFGAPTPDGWGATRLEYLDWLCGELETLPQPVDLIGHDWGGGHVAGVALTRPDLIRSWTIDVAGILHPDYVWHDAAQGWQTAGAGETMIEGMTKAPLSDRIAGFRQMGMSEAIATSVASAVDAEMGRCILSLYRDAAQPALKELGRDLSPMKAKPGLVIIAEQDHYVGTEAMARNTAERAGAAVSLLEGVGHWWMIQDPKAGADAINSFLDGL